MIWTESSRPRARCASSPGRTGGGEHVVQPALRMAHRPEGVVERPHRRVGGREHAYRRGARGRGRGSAPDARRRCGSDGSSAGAGAGPGCRTGVDLVTPCGRPSVADQHQVPERSGSSSISWSGVPSNLDTNGVPEGEAVNALPPSGRGPLPSVCEVASMQTARDASRRRAGRIGCGELETAADDAPGPRPEPAAPAGAAGEALPILKRDHRLQTPLLLAVRHVVDEAGVRRRCPAAGSTRRERPGRSAPVASGRLARSRLALPDQDVGRQRHCRGRDCARLDPGKVRVRRAARGASRPGSGPSRTGPGGAGVARSSARRRSSRAVLMLMSAGCGARKRMRRSPSIVASRRSSPARSSSPSR